MTHLLRHISASLAFAFIQLSCTVTHTLAGTGPGESATSTVTPAPGTAPPAPSTLKITRLLHRLHAEQVALVRRMHVEGETMPKEYKAESSWLILRFQSRRR